MHDNSKKKKSYSRQCAAQFLAPLLHSCEVAGGGERGQDDGEVTLLWLQLALPCPALIEQLVSNSLGCQWS